MRRPGNLPLIRRPLHLNPSPLLQPVCDPLDIRVLIHPQNAQPLARLAPLFEHDRVVSVARKPPDQDGDLLAAPAGLEAGAVAALEAAHDVRGVFFHGFVIGGGLVEPGKWGNGSVGEGG